MIFLFFLLSYVSSYLLVPHPVEKRCAYIVGIHQHQIQNIQKDLKLQQDLRTKFRRYPLLIFRFDTPSFITEKEYLSFLSFFDTYRDTKALEEASKYPLQILKDLRDPPLSLSAHLSTNKNIGSSYYWDSPMLGHPYKLPPIVSGFQICNVPSMGSETVFISGETVYEKLPFLKKITLQNMVIEVNRYHYYDKVMDLQGIKCLQQPTYKVLEKNSYLPVIFPPESEEETYKVCVIPAHYDRVLGMTNEESEHWIENFFTEEVLPSSFTVQFRPGDIVVFNNRRFLYSHVPKDEKSILFASIPTTRSLFGVRPTNLSPQHFKTLGWSSLRRGRDIVKNCENFIALHDKLFLPPFNQKYYTLQEIPFSSTIKIRAELFEERFRGSL